MSETAPIGVVELTTLGVSLTTVSGSTVLGAIASERQATGF